MERAERSGCLLIALEDEGPGIPEEELSMLQIGSFVVGTGAHQAAVLDAPSSMLALRRLNASLTLKNRSDRTGLRAEGSMDF
jgi:hypothetical protein